MTFPRSSMGAEAADEARRAARLREGDETALAEIFVMYHATLCGFAASYVGDTARAEELVQEAFLGLWDRRETAELRGGIRAYLFVAVRNRALNAVRHARYERALTLRRDDDDVPGMGRGAPDTDRAAREAQIDDVVHAAMMALPERMRAALTLSWREGLGYKEIAGILGIAPKTVENHIGRALKLVRRRLAHLL